MVVLGLELFEQVESPVAQSLVARVAPIGEEHGDGSVDHEQVDGEGRQTLVVVCTLRPEGVVGGPIIRDVGGEITLEVIHRLTFHQLTERRLALVIESGKLGYPDMRKILRPQSQEFPHRAVDRRERELMSEIFVFILNLGEISVVESRCLVFIRNGIDVEQSSLSEEYRLHLEDVVAVVGHLIERHIECPMLESIAVDTKAIVAREGDEIRILPRPVGSLGSAGNGLRLVFKSLGLQCRHPRMNGERGEVGHKSIARRIGVGGEQFLVVERHRHRDGKFDLGYKLPPTVGDVAVVVLHHMQHNVVVGGVGVVPVPKPVLRVFVYLHIAHPHRLANAQFGVEEVGPRIAVMQSGVDNLHIPAIGGGKVGEGQYLVFPHVLQQLFHCLNDSKNCYKGNESSAFSKAKCQLFATFPCFFLIFIVFSTFFVPFWLVYGIKTLTLQSIFNPHII